MIEFLLGTFLGLLAIIGIAVGAYSIAKASAQSDRIQTEITVLEMFTMRNLFNVSNQSDCQMLIDLGFDPMSIELFKAKYGIKDAPANTDSK